MKTDRPESRSFPRADEMKKSGSGKGGKELRLQKEPKNIALLLLIGSTAFCPPRFDRHNRIVVGSRDVTQHGGRRPNLLVAGLIGNHSREKQSPSPSRLAEECNMEILSIPRRRKEFPEMEEGDLPQSTASSIQRMTACSCSMAWNNSPTERVGVSLAHCEHGAAT